MLNHSLSVANSMNACCFIIQAHSTVKVGKHTPNSQRKEGGADDLNCHRCCSAQETETLAQHSFRFVWCAYG